MKISPAEVIHAAHLAKLRLDTGELKRFQKELNTILEYMDMLADVDTSSAVETVHTTSFENVLREDAVRQSQGVADALLNSPCSKEGQVVVPKVIG